MRTLGRQFLSRQFIRFLFAGAIAAAMNIGSRFLYSLFVDFETAVVLAFFTGLTTGYLLSKALVFEQSSNTYKQEMGFYFLVNLLALAQTWSISVGLANYVFPAFFTKTITEALAHFIGVSFPVFTSFIGHKYLTFRRSK